MLPILSPQQAREFDQFAASACGVPGLLLMENAGLGVAQILRGRGLVGQSVCIVCGPGNNGGDGFVAARHLHSWGVAVEVLLLVEQQSLVGDAAVMASAYCGVGGKLTECLPSGAAEPSTFFRSDLIVDAIFGTGLNRELSEFHRQWVNAINDSSCSVISLDSPSGLDAKTGAIWGSSVIAQETLVFGHLKTGLLTNCALPFTGAIRCVPLGVPASLGPGKVPTGWCVEAADAVSWLRGRGGALHKGQAGRVLIFAGSRGKTGAATLAALGALRGGAGLVTVATFPEGLAAIAAQLVEAMTACVEPGNIEASADALLARCDSVVIGPGLGLSDGARKLTEHVVLRWPGIKIVDADALTHFEGRAHLLSRAAGQCLLTPHPGELGRLLGSTSQQVEADRWAAWRQCSELTGQTLLLKGPYTLVGEPETPPWICAMGRAVLATGGTGDVLAGLCGALSVGRSLSEAAALAAVVHGHAAQVWVASHRGADRGMLARQLSEHLPAAFASLAEARSLVSQ